MNKIKLLFVGRMKENYYAQAFGEYLKRLSAYADVTVKEIKEESGEVAKALADEGERISHELKGRVICLAVEGTKLSSEGFARILKSYRDRGEELTFVVGGSNGIAPSVKGRADLLLSFSDMTFPHSLARVMLAEQLYRAYSILAGGKYHK